MATAYSDAPEVREIAGPIIDKHHPHLREAHDDGTLRYIFRSEAAKSKGRIVMGKARIKAGLDAHMASAPSMGEIVDDLAVPDQVLIVEIAADVWAELNKAKKRALVDHELCHFKVTDTGKFGILGHDMEEFEIILRRHGLWEPNLEAIADAIKDAS